MNDIGSCWDAPFDYRLAPCNSTKEIADARTWFDVRKKLTPDYAKSDFENDKRLCDALKLAENCEHPDSKFLCSLIGSVKTLAKARARLIGQDPRCLCFVAVFSNPIDMTRLQQAADAGNSFAQAILAKFLVFAPAANDSTREVAFQLATSSANQGDRDGYDLLAHFYETGVSCRADKNLTLCYLRWAAYLHDEFALEKLCRKLSYLDPELWFWKGLRAGFGFDSSYFVDYRGRIEDWRARTIATQQSESVVFEIGRALALFSLLQIDEQETNHAAAVEYYHHQSKSCRAAIAQWCLIAIRINSKINRDIRKKIALLIWACRNESVYE